jgi:hypothetical protein
MPAQKPQEEEGGEGAPLWIISFADMTSLLMAFFVMLSTFSSFGEKASKELEGIGKRIVNSGGWNYKSNYKALLGAQAAANVDDTAKGSEKPTKDKKSNGKSMKRTPSKDFRNHRVFVIESSQVFWSKGTALTAEGRKFLKTLAIFINKIPSRVIISEYGPNDTQLGLQRAWAAVEYLAEAGISPDMCSISTQTTLAEQKPANERTFEVTLLDRRIYK